MTRPTVVDFFSGCGGTSVGFRKAGLPVALGIDVDRDAAATFRTNFPEAEFLQSDVRQLTEADIRPLLPKGPLLFAGCAPCQPFSRQNRHKQVTDPRRGLLGEFGRLIDAMRPDFVVVENVPGMQRLESSEPLLIFLKLLRDCGYKVTSEILRSLDYGVPQERQRLVVVASRHHQPKLPDPSHGAGRKKVTTVRDSIGGFPALRNGGADVDDADHVAMKLSPLNLERIRATPEGGDRRDWPERLRLPCHQEHSGHSDVYGRMSWDRPSSGLTTRCISYSNGRFGHPVQDRAISVREAASLQSFPSSFTFEGSMTAKARQIGNAVPPLMAESIARSLCEILPVD